MKRLIFLFAFIHTLVISGQCDLALTGYDPISGDVSLVVLDDDNCGCNEFTSVGTTCEGSGSTIVNNNTNVSHLVFGLHYDDLFENTNCTETPYHPGWTYANYSNPFGGWSTGDEINFNLNDLASDSWDCVLNTELDGECWELVIWQINLSQTADPDDFPNDYWTNTCGTCANQTQIYPDTDLSNNTLVWCPGELPPAPLYPGCMDPEATNFSDTAGYDDGSCIYPAVPGCTDPVACNYDQNATENDGSCIYCDESLCIWVAPWCYGCTDPTALNYDESSMIDDGTCIYSQGPDLIIIDAYSTGNFCTSWGMPGFYIEATLTNIGNMEVVDWCATNFLTPNQWNCPNVNFMPGDTITLTFNYVAAEGWIPGQSTYLDLDFVEGPNGFQEIVTGNNTFAPITMPDMPDCEEIIEGCMDECALNYNPDANEDDGSCEYYETVIDTVYVDVPVYITDTLYITEYDTVEIEIEVPVYITDTLYITEYDTIEVEVPVYITDTLYVTEYDTIEVEVPVYIIDTLYVTEYEYVYLTDTIFIDVPVDCETGLPCGENPGIDICDPWTIFIPNTFTPNNDSWNDVWEMIYDVNCWVDVEFRIFNRWGTEIYHGFGDDFDSYPYWDGSVNGGNHYVSDGVYTYTFYARRHNSPQIFQKTGHITVLR